MIHAAFQERREEGLLFSCLSITEDEFRAKVGDDGVVFVAFDLEDGRLLGTSVTHQRKDKKGVLYGYNELLAVHPDARRCGIASSMLKTRLDYHRQAGSEYVLSDTASGATSSIRYHLKNGFKIIGLRSFPQTNYFSYLFRIQLIKETFGQRLYANDFFCRGVYLLSALRTRFVRRADGRYTRLAGLFIKRKG